MEVIINTSEYERLKMIKLSIMIAFTSERNEVMKPLVKSLAEQIKGLEDAVEIIFDNHETDNIGIKRNRMLNEAKGEYLVSIDSDDAIHPNYISLILEACKSNADCIGISGTILHEGITKQWHISKDYGSWFTKDQVFYRTPNHISPVKREIALKAMFPEIPHGEDAEYSRRILPFLHTETIIKENIYFYYPSH